MAEPSQTAAGPMPAKRVAGEGMPRGVRRLLVVLLAVLLAGAAYLLAVRGEALILDLAALSQRLFCF
jgi:hypothetical protein